MRIGIIGAGFAGLVAAKVLTEFGHETTVFDRTPDVGGVWSRTRRYPGLTTQNNKGTYAYSDFPMPRDYPEWPTGAQVQAYLESYVHRFGLESLLRLNTDVTSAVQDPTSGEWTVTTSSAGDTATRQFDFLVVANGNCSDPLIPDYPGVEEYRAGGGRLCHTSEFTELSEAAGRNVLVVGYGKSSCDLAVAVSEVAARTTVVARNLIWKVPRRLGNLLNYKYLLLTRMGEGLFPYRKTSGFERFLHGRGAGVTRSMVGSVQALISRQLGLKAAGLEPRGPFTDIARSTVSLVTEDFHPRIAEGRIVVRRDDEIVRLLVQGGRPSAQLGSGEIVPADLVICGTGFHQRVPFLADEVQAQLFDQDGNFELYHQILPLSVPKLAFVGYNASFFSPLGSEIGALWVADYLGGTMPLPPVAERRARVREWLRWTEERTRGKHSRGTNVIPFSMHQIDEMLADIRLDVDRKTRFKQWLLPVDPGSYQVVAAKLHRRHGLLRAARAAVAASNETLKAMTLPDPPPSGAAGQAAERRLTPRPPKARSGSPGGRTTPGSDR
jgi:cation diffusion facilitator CzcD-associated flavoprotein CzcO